MGFNNASIKEPRPGKPHICKRWGYWRVSKSKPGLYQLYIQAHNFTHRLNAEARREVV